MTLRRGGALDGAQSKDAVGAQIEEIWARPRTPRRAVQRVAAAQGFVL